MIKVAFVCHGNICRSPMAEMIMAKRIKDEGLAGKVAVSSFATSTEEIGSGIHYGTRAVLGRHAVPIVPHVATRITKSDYDHMDYVVCMDENNIRNLHYLLGSAEKATLLLSFAGENEEVDDPWYTGDFEKAYFDISRGVDGLIKKIKEKL